MDNVNSVIIEGNVKRKLKGKKEHLIELDFESARYFESDGTGAICTIIVSTTNEPFVDKIDIGQKIRVVGRLEVLENVRIYGEYLEYRTS